MQGDPSIAIAHKDYDVRGGGEILAEHLARTFGAPLYVGHGHPANEPEDADFDVREIAPESRYHRFMDGGGGVLRGIAHMFHWRDNARRDLREFDTLVLSGNEPLWYLPDDDQTVVAYTHSTPRHMYDLHNDMDGFVSRTYNQVQRRLYEGCAKRPDLFVANSDRVARRIRQYWNVPADQIRVVYPPIETSKYSPDDAETGDYYVTVGRLDRLKHVDEIVRECNRRGAKLVVAGDGPERDHLEKLAGPTVELAGYVSEERKRELLAGARAFIFNAANEDFGIAPVEAFAAGTPVIGVREGFTAYQVRDGENGMLFDRGRLGAALDRFERAGVTWSDAQIAEFARLNFSLGAFEQGMREAVQEAERRAAVEPDFSLPAPELDTSESPVVEAETDGGEPR
jgi:glycosyltransferase involved in cell wall biosynthesis